MLICYSIVVKLRKDDSLPQSVLSTELLVMSFSWTLLSFVARLVDHSNKMNDAL